jgi:hypothetical protein
MVTHIPGIFGFSAVLEFLMLYFLITIIYPKWSWTRILYAGVSVFLFVSFLSWLGNDLGSRLLETIWSFVF